MTPTESERRLREFVQDPEGAYPVLRRAIEAKLQARARALAVQPPNPETAFADLFALHTLYVEMQQWLEPEGFVRSFNSGAVE